MRGGHRRRAAWGGAPLNSLQWGGAARAAPLDRVAADGIEPPWRAYETRFLQGTQRGAPRRARVGGAPLSSLQRGGAARRRGGTICTCDLRRMKPTSYYCSTPRCSCRESRPGLELGTLVSWYWTTAAWFMVETDESRTRIFRVQTGCSPVELQPRCCVTASLRRGPSPESHRLSNCTKSSGLDGVQ